jgi:NADH-quinone oxidoreductase subunit J
VTPAIAYPLYLVFALGALGLFCLLPRTDKPKTLAGMVISVSALAGLLVLLALHVAAPDGHAGFFCVFATLAIFGGVRVITHPRPIYSAVWFVLVIVAVAALLVLLHAEFLAVALIIIYAGAILVTYVFVIMLAQHAGEPTYDRRAREPFGAVAAGFVLMAAVAGDVSNLPAPKETAIQPVVAANPAETAGQADSQAADAERSNTTLIGVAVMTRYVVALEIAGILLLIAMIGAIALSRKRVPSERIEPERRPLGEVGKEVEPF